MLCEKCGKNNLSDAAECSFCGAPMPLQEKCNGFADILTYTPPETGGFFGGTTAPYSSTQTEGISEQEMKKIIKKTDNIMQFSQKNIIISLASVVLGLVIVIFSIYMVIVNNNISDKVDKLETAIANINKENKADKNTNALSEEKNKPNSKNNSNNETEIPNTNINSDGDLENLGKYISEYSENNRESEYNIDKLDEFIKSLNDIDKSELDEKGKEKVQNIEKAILEMYDEYFTEKVKKIDESGSEIKIELINDIKDELTKFEENNKKLINKEQNGMSEDIDEINKDILELYIKYFKKESVKTDKLATLKNEYSTFKNWYNNLSEDIKSEEEIKKDMETLETKLNFEA